MSGSNSLLSSQGIITQKRPDDLQSLNSLQKRCICDGLDYFAVEQIKKHLTTEIVAIILKYKSILLAMGLSSGFIGSLLSFGTGKGMKHDAETKNGMPYSDPPILSVLTEEEEKILASQCKSVMECKLCSYQSKSSKLMVRHLGKHDNGNSFVCTNCSYTTRFRSRWNKHKCQLLTERRSQSSQTKATINHHVTPQCNESTKETTAKMFPCDKCPYIGNNLQSLLDHKRKHTGEYFQCTQPGCSFKTLYKRSLKKHLLKTHSTQKVCHTCGLQVNHSSLADHLRRHENSKKHQCPKCSFSSHSSTDVNLHVKRKHLQEKQHACSKCSFQTAYPKALKKHLERHEISLDSSQWKRTTSKKEHCPLCDKMFKTKSDRMKHEKHCNKILPDTTTTTHLQSDTTSVSHGFMNVLDPKLCDVEILGGQQMYDFNNELETDISEEVFNITSNMISHNSVERSTDFTAIVDDSMGASLLTQDDYHVQVNSDPITTCKGRNPMLAETTRTLPSDRDDSPLLGDSLLSLMSDFPRPPPANRCQSATNLMFASLSPHLVDRPLTPDFFSDNNPSTSFFL